MRTPYLTLSLLAYMTCFSLSETQERNKPKNRQLSPSSSQRPASLRHVPSSVKTAHIQLQSNPSSQQISAVSQTLLNPIAFKRSKKMNPSQIFPVRKGGFHLQIHVNLPPKTSSRAAKPHPGKSSLKFTKKSKTHSGVHIHPQLHQSKSFSINQRNVQAKSKPNSLIQPKKMKSLPKISGQQKNKYIKEKPNKKRISLKSGQLNPGLKSPTQQSGKQHSNLRQSTPNERFNIIKYHPHRTAAILPRISKSQFSTNIQQKPNQPKSPLSSTGKQNGKLRNKSKPQKMSDQPKLNTNTNLENRPKQTKICLPQKTNQRRYCINMTKIKQSSHSKTQSRTYTLKIIKYTKQQSQKQRPFQKKPGKPKSHLNLPSHRSSGKLKNFPRKPGSCEYHSNPFKKNKTHFLKHKPILSCKPTLTRRQPLPVPQQSVSPELPSFLTKFSIQKPETTATKLNAPTSTNMTSPSTKSSASPIYKTTASLSYIPTTDEIPTSSLAATTLTYEKTSENMTFDSLILSVSTPASTIFASTSIPSSSVTKSLNRATTSVVTTNTRTPIMFGTATLGFNSIPSSTPLALETIPSSQPIGTIPVSTFQVTSVATTAVTSVSPTISPSTTFTPTNIAAVETTQVTTSTPATFRVTTVHQLPTTITSASAIPSSASALSANTTIAFAATTQFNSTSLSNTEMVTSDNTRNDDASFFITADNLEPDTTMFSTPSSTASTIIPLTITSVISTTPSSGIYSAKSTKNTIKNISIPLATTQTVIPTTVDFTIPAASTAATTSTSPTTPATTASTIIATSGTSASSTLHTISLETMTPPTDTPASAVNTTNDTITITSSTFYETTFVLED